MSSYLNWLWCYRAERGLSGPHFLPHGREKTDCLLLSLDRGNTAHQCYERKQRAIYIHLSFFLHASSFHLCRCACVCAHTEKRSRDCDCWYCQLDWIYKKKKEEDLFKRAKKNQQQTEEVSVWPEGGKERQWSNRLKWDFILYGWL